jgi:limonene-1,2-epoxide hydrolase
MRRCVVAKAGAELVVDRFIAHWARGDVEAMIGCLAEDVRCQNMPMEPTVGTAAVRELQTAFFGVAEDFRIEVHTQVSSGDVVMQERTDYFSLGGQLITLPICGVFEVRDGRIAAWREYFDMATFTGGNG